MTVVFSRKWDWSSRGLGWEDGGNFRYGLDGHYDVIHTIYSNIRISMYVYIFTYFETTNQFFHRRSEVWSPINNSDMESTYSNTCVLCIFEYEYVIIMILSLDLYYIKIHNIKKSVEQVFESGLQSFRCVPGNTTFTRSRRGRVSCDYAPWVISE